MITKRPAQRFLFRFSQPAPKKVVTDRALHSHRSAFTTDEDIIAKHVPSETLAYLRMLETATERVSINGS